MTQPRQVPPNNPAGTGRASSSNTVWWVLIGVAVLALAGIVVWMVARASGPDVAGPDPETSVSSSTEPTEMPTAPEPTEPEPSDEWGGFPPANADSLKDLSDPHFPEALRSFSLQDVFESTASTRAEYMDIDAGTALSFIVDTNTSQYVPLQEGLDGVDYIGDAVCGTASMETGQELKQCLMVGQAQLFYGTSASADITVEDVAALTQELYGQL